MPPLSRRSTWAASRSGAAAPAAGLFAYPNGKLGTDFEPRHADMARRAGFSYAFSTQRGAADARTDRMLLPRYMPWDKQALRFKLQALKVLFGH